MFEVAYFLLLKWLKYCSCLMIFGVECFTVTFIDIISVADPDPVGSGPFWTDRDTDPNFWDRIRILAKINDHV
jgi:uncharacterized membrane protein